MKRVAIQGRIRCISWDSRREFFGEEVEIVPCITFRDIFTTIKKEPNTIGIIAIENTIAGSLLGNYDLLKKINSQ